MSASWTEIKSYAETLYSVSREETLEKFEKKRSRVIAQAAQLRNRGAYLPAVVACDAKRVQESILALAKAYIEAFTLYGVASDKRAEDALIMGAREIVGGSISRISGELHLRSIRLRITEEGVGIPWRRKIEQVMNMATRRALLMFKKQRIDFTRSEEQTAPRGESGDQLLHRKAPIFIYRYDDDFPASDQLEIQQAIQEANRQFESSGVTSFAEYSELRYKWFWQVAPAAAQTIGRVASAHQWSANRRREVLKDFSFQGAEAVQIAGRDGGLFRKLARSERWEALDPYLFPADTSTTSRMGKSASRRDGGRRLGSSAKKARRRLAKISQSRRKRRRGGRPPATEIFGEKVADMREDRSQQRFAQLTGLSIDVIQRAEHGEATARTIQKLVRFAKSKGLSLTADSLIKNTPPKTAKT